MQLILFPVDMSKENAAEIISKTKENTFVLTTSSSLLKLDFRFIGHQYKFYVEKRNKNS